MVQFYSSCLNSIFPSLGPYLPLSLYISLMFLAVLAARLSYTFLFFRSYILAVLPGASHLCAKSFRANAQFRWDNVYCLNLCGYETLCQGFNKPYDLCNQNFHEMDKVIAIGRDFPVL